MSRVAALVTSFCFVATAYAGGLFTMVFPSPFPTLRIDVWFPTMLVFAVATVVFTNISRNRRNPRELAFWGLIIKLASSPSSLSRAC